MQRDSFAASAFLQQPMPSAQWGAWSTDPDDATENGQGLLVSRVFWLGGGVSLLLWGWMTYMVLAFN
ncbi:MAG: hypothetical protein NVS2B4_07000 [Ramlibacter sp.]